MPEQSSEDDVGPTITKNYRVFEITISGGEDDSLGDVREAMDEEVEQAMSDVEDLKRIDFELEEEYQPEAKAQQTKPVSGPGGSMHQ